jgi:hypothetical protein
LGITIAPLGITKGPLRTPIVPFLINQVPMVISIVPLVDKVADGGQARGAVANGQGLAAHRNFRKPIQNSK